MKEKISLSEELKIDKDILVSKGFLELKKNKYVLTIKSKIICATLDSYFIKAKKKTDIQIMGVNFLEKINSYRNIFPLKKLPSGNPARTNVKTLIASFKWFFETYNHEWKDVLKATSMYVNEYRNAEYLYMQTSQYFICKQDKDKIKYSRLADYCDMIKEGIDTEEKTFKEKVV